MNYTVKDLKEIAKKRGKIGYHKLNKTELCNMLNIQCDNSKYSPKFSKKTIVHKELDNNYTLQDLKNEAKIKKIPNYSKMNKLELCNALGLPCDDIKTGRKVYNYTRNELIEMADKKNINIDSKMTIPKICELLKIQCQEKPKIKLVKDTRENKEKILDKIKNKSKIKPKINLSGRTKEKSTKSKLIKSKIIKSKKPKEQKKGKNLVNKHLSNIQERKLKEKEKLSKELEQKKLDSIEQQKNEKKIRLSKNCIERSINPLKPHQLQVVNYFPQSQYKGLIVNHQTGYGKSLIAACCAECFLENVPDSKVLIVCPLAVINQMAKTITETYGSKFDLYYNNNTYYSKETIKVNETIVTEDSIINREIDVPRYLIIGPDKFRNTFRKFSKENYESYFKNTLTIFDEAHSLRGKDSNKVLFKVAKKCSKYSKKILLLTGTLIYNDLYDSVNLLSLSKDIDPIDESLFYQMVDKDTGEIFDTKLSKNYFSGVVSFFKTEDTVYFPKKLESVIHVPMSPEIYYAYKKIECIQENSNKMVFQNGLRTAAEGVDVKSNNKYLAVKSILDKIYEDSENEEKGSGRRKVKSLIFSQFKEKGIGGMMKLLNNKSRYVVSQYTGDTDYEERVNLIDKFNKNEINILLVTKAGGEGLDLKGVRNVFFLESQWNPSVIEQSAARAIRYKSHFNLPIDERIVHIYYMVYVKPSIEERIKIVKELNKYDTFYLSLSPSDQNLFDSCKEMQESSDQNLFNLCKDKLRKSENFIKSFSKYSI